MQEQNKTLGYRKLPCKIYKKYPHQAGCFLLFVLTGIHSYKAEQPLESMELQEKEVQKD